MGLFNRLGRGVEKFKQDAMAAAEETKGGECPTCDTVLTADQVPGECPECGTDVREAEKDA
ncbi:MAG: hypothetical protein ABEJ05_03780 [Haloglomus sp.]